MQRVHCNRVMVCMSAESRVSNRVGRISVVSGCVWANCQPGFIGLLYGSTLIGSPGFLASCAHDAVKTRMTFIPRSSRRTDGERRRGIVRV